MYYFSSFPLAVLIGLWALHVQASLYPREAGLPPLPSKAIIKRVYKQYRDRRQDRNLQSLHERHQDAPYQSDHGFYHQRAGANDKRLTPTFGHHDLNFHSRDSYHNAQTKLYARSGRGGTNLKALVSSPFARPRPSDAPLPRVSPGGTPLARAGSDGNYPPNVNMGMAFGSSTELSSDTDGSSKPLLAAGARHGPSDHDPHPVGGYINVLKGQAGFLSYSGDNSYMISTGFVGGIGVVAMGAPGTGAVIAHVETGQNSEAIRLMWILLMQKNIHKEAKVYAPAKNGELINPNGAEMTAIKHALRASGIWNAEILPYAVSESHPGGFTLKVDTRGTPSWEGITRSPRVLSPPKSRRPEPARTSSKVEEVVPQQVPPQANATPQRMRFPGPKTALAFSTTSEPAFSGTENGFSFERRPSISAPNLSNPVSSSSPPASGQPNYAPGASQASSSRLSSSPPRVRFQEPLDTTLGGSPDSPSSPPVYGPSVYAPFKPADDVPGASGASTPRFGSPIRGSRVPSQQGSPDKAKKPAP